MDATLWAQHYLAKAPQSLLQHVLPPAVRRSLWDLPALPSQESSPPNKSGTDLLIGPANSAGQGQLWAEAVAELPGVEADHLFYQRGGTGNLIDSTGGSETAVAYNARWQKSLEEIIESRYSHLLVESLRPLLGSRYYQDPQRELRHFQRLGIKTGLIWHGSDIRLPSRHLSIYSESVFQSPLDGLRAQLEEVASRNAAKADELSLPEFVSTPDLLDYRPQATWLPTLIDPSRWPLTPLGDTSQASRKPRVLHLPSRAAMKGSAFIVPVLEEFDAAGKIEYIGPQQVPHAQMPQLLSTVDVVIDAIGVGGYGVAALEALASGKIVIGQVGTPARRHIAERFGQAVPIVEASANTLTEALTEVLDRFDTLSALEAAENRRRFVTTLHSPISVRNSLHSFLSNKPPET